MNKSNLKISFIINIVIFIMVLLGTIFMITGFKFMSNTEVLATTGLSLFKFYTVDSNIFAGLASLILIIYEILILNKRIDKIPKFAYIMKYIGTVAVSLTFLVTLFYLAPSYGKNFWFLYQNSNLLFHLLVPILSFISFVCFEKIKLNFKYTFYGVSTMILYGIYYVSNILIHQENGKVAFEYDWYGFVQNGVSSIFIVFPVILLITYLIGLIIYKLNSYKGD